MLNENSTAREIEQQNVNTKFHMDRLNQALYDVTFGDMVKLMGNTLKCSGERTRAALH